jgi:D-3-phosphoglycerate dehydrogenase
MSVELVDLDELVQRADFVTLHLAKTKETVGLIGHDLLMRAKPGIRIINVARGGIVDEAALAEAIRAGKVGGAALDVFAEEPTTSSPLFELDEVVVTPHLGASTREAQDKAGDTIADMVQLALAGDFVPFAVNVSAAEASETVRPFLPLAERLGRLHAALAGSVVDKLEVEYQGQLADYDTRILTLSVLKGFFGATSDQPVSYVNAPQIATERGVEVATTTTSATEEYVNLITVRGGGHAIAGTLAGPKAAPRITMLDDLAVDLPPSRNLLVVRNDDRPGMIATVAMTLAENGINIDDMHLGHAPDGAAAMQVLATTPEVGPEVQDVLRQARGILSVHVLTD